MPEIIQETEEIMKVKCRFCQERESDAFLREQIERLSKVYKNLEPCECSTLDVSSEVVSQVSEKPNGTREV